MGTQTKKVIKLQKKSIKSEKMLQTNNLMMMDLFNQPQVRLISRKRPRKSLSPLLQKRLAGCEWSNKMELSILPTTADNLTIKIEKEKLVIKGKSESTTDCNGFKTKSTHQWSREMKIPDHINHESIKVKLNEDKETLTIESENIEKKSTQIPITIE